MIHIETFIFNPFSENTYVLFDVETKESCIIDPGCYEEFEKQELNEFILNNHLKVKYLFNTHGHIDHVLGNNYIKSIYNPEFYFPHGDIFLLDLLEMQASSFNIKLEHFTNPDKYFTEELELSLGNIKLNFIHTPGHTPGEYCIYLPQEKVCFTGDVLFNESIGRTDLWQGNYKDLFSSILNKLYSLPNNTIIYPGHGDTSTIQHEKKHNPFVKAD